MAKTKRHPGTLRLKGKSWHLTLWAGGKPHYFALGPMTRPDAEEAARREYARLQRAYSRSAGARTLKPLRMSELFTEFETNVLPDLAPNTQKTYLCTLKKLRAYFVDQLRDPRADHVTRRDVKAYMALRKRADKVSARTIAKDVATLSAIFSHGVEIEEVEANPAQNITLPKAARREPIILKPDQYEALLAACASNPMLYLFVLVLGETGIRSGSEALWLRWEHLDMAGSRIIIHSSRSGHRTKSGKSRVVPMTPRLKQALIAHALKYRAAIYDGNQSPWVFHHPIARRRAMAGDRLGSLRRAFEAAVKRAGLPSDLHQHDLRHTRVTTWLAAGANPVHVREAVGHSDLRTTMGYTHLVEEHVAALAALSVASKAEKHA